MKELNLKVIRENLYNMEDLRGSEKRKAKREFESYLISQIKENMDIDIEEVDIKINSCAIICWYNSNRNYVKIHFYQGCMADVILNGDEEYTTKLN